jgi:hypothetical protein
VTHDRRLLKITFIVTQEKSPKTKRGQPCRSLLQCDYSHFIFNIADEWEWLATREGEAALCSAVSLTTVASG